MAEVQIRRLTQEADGSGDDLVVLDTLPYKEAIHWTSIVARDLINKCSRIDLLLLRSRVPFVLRSRAVVSRHDTINLLNDVYASGEYRVAARFIGAEDGDDLELYAYGIVQREYPIE